MKKRDRRPWKRRMEKGFTLVEILVVMVILGLLAGVVGIKIIGRIEQGKVLRAKLDIKSFKTALASYYADNGFYPSTEQGMEALVTAPTGGRVPQNYLEGGYIEKVPKDPWNNDYIFICPGQHGDYDIVSYGKDGQKGGDKDIESWSLE